MGEAGKRACSLLPTTTQNSLFLNLGQAHYSASSSASSKGACFLISGQRKKAKQHNNLLSPPNTTYGQ
ncbi:unnamed protein product [Chondrus crispus]|uniref:Uncharacterized protein n=1 Tax=Chondrus crispus TaxID=2769 RepID=R7QAN0_CHOCR|nr:unnamed protein product [Chondrus crispus]CDF34500.1 unnamed protein product [Chondrus crispus]|eukprot:XP_005714319.1 unnamed protein product [Chondrus crispus]